MISEQLYVWHHSHFIYDILCTKHNVTLTLWVHTIVVTTLHPLHSWHHTQYIWHHTHDNTKVISAISPSISDTTSAVSVSSNPVYQFYHTHSLYDITHYTYGISFSMHGNTCPLTPCIGMTSHPVYLWHHMQYIWYHPYCFMKTKQIYLTSHPLYLTSQPLDLCGDTHSINDFTTIMEIFTLGTRMSSYTPYITLNSDFMTSIISI